MKLEDKLIKAVKENLKAKKGFILIFNGETGKIESVLSDMCYHEVVQAVDEHLLEEEEDSDFAPRPFFQRKRHIS